MVQKKAGKYQQSFPTTEKQYRLNKATGELVELPDDLDIVKLVQSSFSTTFDVVLARFLDDDRLVVDDTSHFVDDFDSLQEASMLLDDIKSSYNLPDEFSINDVAKFLDDKIKKGGDLVEEKDKTVEQTESKDFSSSGEESS